LPHLTRGESKNERQWLTDVGNWSGIDGWHFAMPRHSDEEEKPSKGGFMERVDLTKTIKEATATFCQNRIGVAESETRPRDIHNR
jgi:hypothetical protein